MVTVVLVSGGITDKISNQGQNDDQSTPSSSFHILNQSASVNTNYVNNFNNNKDNSSYTIFANVTNSGNAAGTTVLQFTVEFNITDGINPIDTGIGNGTSDLGIQYQQYFYYENMTINLQPGQTKMFTGIVPVSGSLLFETQFGATFAEKYWYCTLLKA
jgi:hypothetical protein